MSRCIYCREAFDHATREHVLQNFLGARWDTPDIVCNTCQDYFGGTIDVAFERGLQPIRNLFATRGGRGGEGPTLRGLTSTAGEPIDLQPGAEARLREPIVQVTPKGGKQYHVRVQLGHQGQLGWALRKLKDQLPGVNITDESVRHLMTPERTYLAGAVHSEWEIGGLDFFRGVVKAAFNLLAAHAADGPTIALDPAFDAVRTFVRDGRGDMHDFVRWLAQDDLPLPTALGPLDQAIGLISRGASVEGFVQVFGHIQIPLRLTSLDSHEAGCD